MRGYLEGYYGRLLDWSARVTVLDALAEHGLDTYAYAPKEDARHRLRWRDPYDAAWRSDFAAFCRAARARGVSVIAGVAPGIDFDFASLAGGADLEATVDKLARLRDDGASRLMLLLDDIDPDFARRDGGIASEGEAHARLANRLGERLDAALVVVAHWVTAAPWVDRLATRHLRGGAPARAAFDADRAAWRARTAEVVGFFAATSGPPVALPRRVCPAPDPARMMFDVQPVPVGV